MLNSQPLQIVFITGGSGFVGRNLIAALTARGIHVRALARSAEAVKEVQRAGAEPIQGDLHAEDALRAGMAGCDVVFHVAAKVEDWGRYEDFYQVNVLGTERVLSAARAAGVPRLVHVSTESVLLGKPIHNANETHPQPAHPLGMYGSTKALAEQHVCQANSSTLSTMVVRPRFIWGRGDTSLLPQLVRAVRTGSFLWISGGHHLTSTCNVANVCEGMILAAEQGRGGDIYFLTDGEPIEFRVFLTTLLRTQGVEMSNHSVPHWLAYGLAWGSEWVWRILQLKGNPPLTRSIVRLIGEEVTVDDSKARRELGYTSALSREAGLAEMS